MLRILGGLRDNCCHRMRVQSIGTSEARAKKTLTFICVSWVPRLWRATSPRRGAGKKSTGLAGMQTFFP
jgi:hypothetical protein